MLSPCFTPQLGERVSPIYILFLGEIECMDLLGQKSSNQPIPTNLFPRVESYLGSFQGGKVIFCMTSEVSGSHIVTNSTNTSWQSWRYLKTPFLFIPSQNGWWSCPSRSWGDPIFIYINNLYLKDLIILSLQPVCSDLFLYIWWRPPACRSPPPPPRVWAKTHTFFPFLLPPPNKLCF